jgi:hypothetical protein
VERGERVVAQDLAAERRGLDDADRLVAVDRGVCRGGREEGGEREEDDRGAAETA